MSAPIGAPRASLGVSAGRAARTLRWAGSVTAMPLMGKILVISIKRLEVFQYDAQSSGSRSGQPSARGLTMPRVAYAGRFKIMNSKGSACVSRRSSDRVSLSSVASPIHPSRGAWAMKSADLESRLNRCPRPRSIDTARVRVSPISMMALSAVPTSPGVPLAFTPGLSRRHDLQPLARPGTDLRGLSSCPNPLRPSATAIEAP